MSEELATMPSTGLLIFAFLAGAAFSTVMIYFITWMSDKLRESERAQTLRYRKEVEVPPTGAMDTEQMLNVLRQIRKDRELSTEKEANETNQMK